MTASCCYEVADFNSRHVTVESSPLAPSITDVVDFITLPGLHASLLASIEIISRCRDTILYAVMLFFCFWKSASAASFLRGRTFLVMGLPACCRHHLRRQCDLRWFSLDFLKMMAAIGFRQMPRYTFISSADADDTGLHFRRDLLRDASDELLTWSPLTTPLATSPCQPRTTHFSRGIMPSARRHIYRFRRMIWIKHISRDDADGRRVPLDAPFLPGW